MSSNTSESSKSKTCDEAKSSCKNIKIVKTTWPDGKLQNVEIYNDDEKHVCHLSFWSDGSPKSIESFLNGEKHGEFRAWSSEGELFSYGSYKNGKKDGEFMEWVGWTDNTKKYTTYKDGKHVDSWVEDDGKKVNFVCTGISLL